VSNKVPGQSEKWDDVIRQLTSVWTPESAARVLAAIAQLDLQGSSSEGDVITRVGDKFMPHPASGGGVQVVDGLLLVTADVLTTDPEVWRAFYRDGAVIKLSRGPVLVLHTADGSDPDLYFAGPLGATVEVDWGDGTAATLTLLGVTEDLASNEVEATHTYTDAVANHVITITVQEGITLDSFEAYLDSATHPAPDVVPWLVGIRTLIYSGFGPPFPDLSALAATLQSLGFRHGDLAANPFDLTAFTALRRLDLSVTDLQTFPDLACEETLEVLNLSGTALMSAYVNGFTALQTLGLSSAFITSLDLSETGALRTLSLDAIPEGPFLSTLDLSSCPLLGTVSATGHATLVSVTVTGCLALRSLNLAGAALSEATVNSILANGVLVEAAVPGQQGYLDLSGGTSAPPSGQGATDAAALVTAGWTVLVNGA
jgi:hypothetical protein